MGGTEEKAEKKTASRARSWELGTCRKSMSTPTPYRRQHRERTNMKGSYHIYHSQNITHKRDLHSSDDSEGRAREANLDAN